jgi:hypothetical protein
MKVAPKGSSLIACLWSAPETNGVAAAAVPVAYWVDSIRKP